MIEYMHLTKFMLENSFYCIYNVFSVICLCQTANGLLMSQQGVISMRKVVKVFGVLAVILGLTVGFAPVFQPLRDTVAEAATAVWQCSKCGQQIRNGGSVPGQGSCRSGGRHVWQRLQ